MPGEPQRGRRAPAVRRGASRAGHAVRRATTSGARRARAWTTWGGAGESGLSKAIELHFVNLAGDAAVTVSLAGTVFAMPTGEARGEVARFLLLTLAPFVLLAPFVGPLLDRFRHGRRWAIGTTLALRAFLCWVLADAVARDSAWLFPAALGCLVASRAYAVTRASAVPRLLPPGFSLVSANSRSALAGVAGMAVGGLLAVGAARIGPEWSLRLAFAIYVVGTVLAIRLPARVDSALGERGLEDTVEIPVRSRAAPRRPLARVRAKIAALPTAVLAALCSAMGTRLLIGFLTLFVAFLMREHPLPGLSGTVTLGLVVAAAGAGNALGTVIGNLLARRRPEVIISSALLVTVAAALATALAYSLWTLLALGLVAGLSSQLVKVGTDAVVQRDVAESVRTQVFAWVETSLQMAWVVGGAIGIALPLNPQLGFGVLAGLLVLVLLLSVWVRVSRAHHPARA